MYIDLTEPFWIWTFSPALFDHMPRPPASSEDAEQRAHHAAEHAADLNSLRAAQAVLLPLQGLTLAQTAQVVGKSRFWVSRARNAFLRGEPAPKEHGGRRHALVDEDEEVELFKLAVQRHWLGFFVSVHVRHALRDVLEERGYENVSESAVTALLHRAFDKMFPGGDFRNIQSLAGTLSQKWRIDAELERVNARYCTRPGTSA
jgi:transposase